MSIDLQSVLPKGIPNHGIPACNTEDLRRILEPAIAELERNTAPLANDPEHPGVREWIGVTASHMRGLKEDAGRRRLYGIATNESETISIDWADTFFLIIGKHLGNEALPVMPGSKGSALEMVAAYSDCDLNEAMSLPEQKTLAESMYRFARGYLYAERVFAACEEMEREVVAA